MSNLSAIDSNFRVESRINKPDIRFYDSLEDPFRIYGVFYDDGKFRRMPESIAQTISPNVLRLHTHAAGGRIRFRTNSPYVAIKAQMPVVGKLPHFSLSGTAGFDLYDGTRYIENFVPPLDIVDGFEEVITLGNEEMHDVTIHFPLYSELSQLYIGISNKAILNPPTPYTYETPIVYYGSSITQGGCASRAGMAYPNIISRRLRADHINLGFSGSAKAEPEIADYIKTLDMSLFVYDYDHNAASPEALQQTHERMFRIIRDANPDLPIVCASRPQYYMNDNIRRRLDVIQTTVENSRNRGDDKVWLLTGQQLMALTDGDGLVDGCHPNDLGFYSMAKSLSDLIETIL